MRTLLLLALVAVLLAVFNPRMEDFQAFAREQAADLAGAQVGEGRVGEALGGLLGGAVGRNISRVTRRDNNYLWSTYTVDLDGPTGTANEWKFLGIATQFIELRRPEALAR